MTGARLMPMANSQWGAEAQGIRSFDIGINLAQLLGVSTDGDALLIGRLYDSLRGSPTVIYDGGLDLSEPVATRGNEWLVVDRRPTGSRLLVVTADGSVRQVPFGPLADERVLSFALSADGTRLAALTQSIRPRPQGPPRLVLGTVRLGGTDGRSVVGVDGVHDLVTSDGVLRDLRSVSWVDATTIGVLGRVGGRPVAPYTVRIDGSQLVNEWILPTALGDPRRLVTSTAPEGGVFVRNGLGRLWFEADGEWRPVDNAGPLVSPSFPG
jgi:Lipoprotein LpqB beta-propeller domain